MPMRSFVLFFSVDKTALCSPVSIDASHSSCSFVVSQIIPSTPFRFSTDDTPMTPCFYFAKLFGFKSPPNCTCCVGLFGGEIGVMTGLAMF